MPNTNFETDMHAERSHPKLLPLKYSRDYPLTREWVERYHNEYFEKDLHAAYQIDESEDLSYSLLTIFKDDKVGEMPIVWNGVNHFYMFSQSIFFMSLCQQVIGKLYGWDAMEKFMSASGWPMITCFMAGLRHPIYIIQYAGLFHLKGLEIAYCELLELSLPYFLERMSQFLDNTDVNIQKVINEIYNQVELLKSWVKDPTSQFPILYATESGQI